jgi:hypothetical protein
MVLTDKGHMFIWGRCSNGRMGFAPQATVEAPHEIQLPGGAERWHPICIAAGGRHSMCMALPRHTVTDHERRLSSGIVDFEESFTHARSKQLATPRHLRTVRAFSYTPLFDDVCCPAGIHQGSV